jgi:hypothetical protein
MSALGTPQSTIEGIMYCVFERGLDALKEPANVDRLSQCDRAAKAQINQRIARLRRAEEAAAVNEEVHDYVADALRPAAPTTNGHDTHLPPTPKPLPLSYFDQLAEAPKKQWLIKGVIARSETSSWIAPPGKGKSALLTDIAVHLATGDDWRGYRTSRRAGVVYFALERAELVKRRLFAHKQRDALLANTPIAVSSNMINLLDKQAINVILATIRKAEQTFMCEVGLVIFDTYSKGIAAGGGDEDKARDQNAVQANLRRLFELGGNFHIAGIGHTGKDETKGERGSNARLADVDVQIQIMGDAIKSATITKANDQPNGELTGFQIEPFDLGPDEDGDPFCAFIVGKELFSGAKTAGRRLSDRQQLALKALAEATLGHGCDPPPAYSLPAGIRVVAIEHWREELRRSNVIDNDGSNPRARVAELRRSLAARNLIGSRDDLVWSVRSI